MASAKVSRKVMITAHGDLVASRFDLCSEIVIVELEGAEISGEPRIMLLSAASGDEICGMAIKESISALITGAIEEEHYEYLCWKKILVLDRVVGGVEESLMALAEGRLVAGAITARRAHEDGGAG